ncbi:MAG: hypothetical protein U0R52_07295 [Solirubrobacterales bacterium]
MRRLATRFGLWTGSALLVAALGLSAMAAVTVYGGGSGRDCGWGRFGPDNPPGACWRPYSARSPFNTRVPRAPRIASNSAGKAARLAGFGLMTAVLGGVAGTRDDWDHPIFFSRPTDPLYTVHCAYSSSWGRCEVEGMSLRIPAAAQPAAGADAHMAVIDQRTGWEYDFWQVRQKASSGGRLLVSYGGRTRVSGNRSRGLGSDATAAAFGLAAGVVRPAELAAGNIDHALFMTVHCSNGHSAWPAGAYGAGRSCSEIGLSDRYAPAMGQHFILTMSNAEIEALHVARWKKTILHAMARYGLYVGDTSNPTWGIQFESATSFTSFGQPDPWLALGKRLGVPGWVEGGRQYYSFDLGSAVDWRQRLEVAAPCVSRGSC